MLSQSTSITFDSISTSISLSALDAIWQASPPPPFPATTTSPFSSLLGWLYPAFIHNFSQDSCAVAPDAGRRSAMQSPVPVPFIDSEVVIESPASTFSPSPSSLLDEIWQASPPPPFPSTGSFLPSFLPGFGLSSYDVDNTSCAAAAGRRTAMQSSIFHPEVGIKASVSSHATGSGSDLPNNNPKHHVPFILTCSPGIGLGLGLGPIDFVYGRAPQNESQVFSEEEERAEEDNEEGERKEENGEERVAGAGEYTQYRT